MLTKRLFTFFGVVALVGLQSCAGVDDPNLSEVESEIAPPPPTGLMVTNISTGSTPGQSLTWTASAGATQYIIMRGTAGPGSETSYTSCCASGPGFTADHLTANTQYCWEVKAVNSVGQKSGPSNEVCLSTAVTPTVSPPATVTATATSSSRIRVDWTAVTDATKYYVNQSQGGGAFSRIATVSSPSLTVTAINLLASTNYCYTVEAVTAYGQSAPSSPPACDTTFNLGLEGYWRLSEASGSTAADSSGFGRDATLSGGAAFTATNPQAPIDPPMGSNEPQLDTTAGTGVAQTAASITAFRLLGAFTIAVWVRQPTAGTDVRIMGMRKAGVCGTGGGWELSQSSSGLAFLGQSGSLSFGQSLTAGSWTHVAVTFAGGTGGAIRGYVNGVQVASGTYTAANSVAVALGLGHFGGCAGAQALLDEAQVYSRELAPSEVAAIGTVPPAPTGLMITKNVSSGQNLSWTAPGSGADRWVILRGTMSGDETHYTHAPNPPTTFNADHLTPSTQYSWEVETVKNHLISLPSNEVIATTPAGPAAPTGVTATAVSQTRINVAWMAVTGATDYFIYQSTAGASGPYALKGHVSSPALSFGATGLTANTTYWYEVQSMDAGFTKSAMSAPASATTFP